MSRKPKHDLILEDVEIAAVAAEGKAIARVDGMAVFVQFAVPGDIVDIKVVRKHHSYMEGFILALKKPSPMRLEPFCSHFGECGGCKWQLLPYEEQLAAKRQQVEDQLVRIGHLSIPEVLPTLASDNTKYYRNKLEFTFSAKKWVSNVADLDGMDEKDRWGLGFHVGRFFDKVLDIGHCYLQNGPSNEIRNFVRTYAKEHDLEFFDIRNHTGFLRTMVVRTTAKDEVMLIMCFYHEDKVAREALLDALLANFPQIVSLYYVINGKANDSIADQNCILYSGDDAIYETMENLRFKIGPKSFYQTNTHQAYKLYSVVREFADLQGNEVVYDLYTGTGTIAQFVSAKASKVIGIEYVKEAIDDARLNAKGNGITNCTFYAGDMKDILTDDFIASHGKPDVMIVDPPRAGMHESVTDVILRAEAPKIVYVSCNPASQARDLAILSTKYDILKVQPVDMFPHTHHVENVVLLKLK